MKPCPFCREEVRDDALKCRYCGSMLMALPGAQEAAKPLEMPGQVTYVVDEGLVAFAKFAAAILAIFVVVGAFLYGFDLKQSAKEIKEAHDEAQKTYKQIDAAKADVIKLKAETAELGARARAEVDSISKDSEKMRGIVATWQTSGDSSEVIWQVVMQRLAPVLTEEQRASLVARTPADSPTDPRTPAAISQLLAADILRGFDFFRQHGIDRSPVKFSIEKDRNLANAYWDGKQLVFGMGMVNSPFFGPYDSSIAFHEITHSLFDIRWEGESGAVSESICDVVAVVIRGGDWTIGRVRGSDPAHPQVLRSLKAPGHGFDNGEGKDQQIDHMRDFKPGADLHVNSGVLNKAAYLASEGGTHGGITVARGVGRDHLGSIYMAAIKKLPTQGTVTFTDFRNLLVKTAQDIYGKADAETVAQAFHAVGL